MPAITAALRGLAGEAARDAAAAVEAGRSFALDVGDQRLELSPDEVLVEASSPEGYAVAEDRGILVALDTTLTEELRREGLARELVRHIQDARKNAGFRIADRIDVFLTGSVDALAAVVREWGDYIRAETLADELVLAEPPAGAHVETLQHDDQRIDVGVRRR